MAIVVGDYLRVTARIVKYGNEVQNAYHCQVTANPGAVNDAGVMLACAEWMEYIYAPLVALMSNECTFYQVDVYNETQSVSVGFTGWPVLVSGSNVNDVMPEACSGLVRGNINVTKREGRKYFGGFTETANGSDGEMGTSLMNGLALAAIEWVAGSTGSNGVVLRSVVQTKVAGVKFYYDITQTIINNQWDYQRRRKIGVGI